MDIVTEAELKVLDRNWKKYRKENSLDLFGKKIRNSELSESSASNIASPDCGARA